MNLDDEVRRHLRDTGEQVALTPGMVDAVRIRASSRARRQRFILRGLGTLIVLGAIGGLVGVLSSRSNEQATSLNLTPLAETDQTTKLMSADEPADADSSASLASTSPTYETVARAATEDAEVTSTPVSGSSESRWTKVEGPVTGATTEYMYSGDRVLARVISQWFVRDESSWRELEMPASLKVIAVDFGAGEEVLRVAGWLGEDVCTRALVIQVRDGNTWKRYELPNEFATGLVSAVSAARLRVTDHELVLSRVEELSLDPVCLLQSRGIDVVDAEIVDGLIFATDRKAGRVVHSLDKLGPFEAQEFLDTGPIQRSMVSRSADGDNWGTTLVMGQRVAELGVVDGLVVSEDAAHTVHDGQRLDRNQLIPPVALGLIDALASSSGTSLIFEREEGLWFRDSSGEQPLEELTGLPSLWGRLGFDSAELTMVVETSQGPALFVLGG